MSADDDLILEIRDRFQAAKAAWTPIRQQGDLDMRYVAGDPWESKDRRAREAAKRPVLALDELGQYFNQTINDIRANPRAVKFTAKGNGANDTSAEFYANKWRDIEYQSHAQLAYVTAYENCIQRSYGWTRYLTKYSDSLIGLDAQADPRYAYQDIWIEPVANPNMVLPDPMWKRPEMSDLNYLFFTEPWRKTEFKRAFGNEATMTDFSPEFVYRESVQDWVQDDTVLVSEYWTRDRSGQRRLVILKPDESQGETDPRAVWYPRLDESHADVAKALKIDAGRVHDSRLVDDYAVTCRLTNGVEVLKTQRWRGRYIPFSACVGKILYVDRGSGPQREILSMTRLARDPYMLYCYIRTLELETMGMVTKFPYFFYEGQLSAEMLKKLAESLHKPVAGIQVKPSLPGLEGQLLPFPQRNLLAPDLQAYEVFAEAARRAIQAAMGIMPMPTAAQRKNEKSGIALKEIGRQEQMGSFHFAAHYDDHIQHGGIIGEDLMDKIYDTVRDVSVRDAFEKSRIIRINDPDAKEPVFTKGDHLVTISSGPAVESQREAVSDFVGTLSQQEAVMARAGDLVVRIQAKTMNLGPLMDQLADRLKPPDVAQQEQQEEGAPPDPKQLQAQLAQQGQQLQAAHDAIGKLTMAMQTKVQEYEQQRQTELMKADKQAQLQIRLKQMDIAAKIDVARITAAKQTADLHAEAIEEQIAMGHEADQAALDRLHDLNLAAVDHAATLEQADQAHDHAMAQGEQGIVGTLAGQAQQAALTPPDQGAANA